MENNIICINFRRFKTYELFNEWLKKDDNIRYEKFLKQLVLENNKSNNNQDVFRSVDKIWIFDDKLVSFKRNGEKEIIETIDILDAFISNSTYITSDLNHFNKSIKESKPSLNMDYILDKIDKSGIRSLNDEEKEFLKRNF
jgi:hypothetical protein